MVHLKLVYSDYIQNPKIVAGAERWPLFVQRAFLK
jgi:hypothetical protein